MNLSSTLVMRLLSTSRRMRAVGPKAAALSVIPAQRPESRSDLNVYEPDHGSLLVNGRTLPRAAGSGSPAAVSRVDAVAVPAARHAANLREAAKAARVAGRLLIVICSHKCRPADARRQLTKFDPQVPVLIVDLEGYVFPHGSKTLEWTRRTGWTSNTAIKRNLALLLARRLGLRHVLFLDDDVRKVDSGQVKYSVADIESGVHRAAGWSFRDFPDNSAVSHAYRSLDKPRYGKQGCFIGGGGLLVRIDDDVPHFPMGIYNEDWFFLVPLLLRRQVRLLGFLKQENHDPFQNEHAGEIQEFGDLIAEALFTLIAREGADLDLAATLRSPSFWATEIDRRSEFLRILEADLVAENAQQSVSPRLSKLEKPEARHPEKVLSAVRSAAAVLARIQAKDLRDWARAWQADEEAWRQLWKRWEADPEERPEPRSWSIARVEKQIEGMLDEMGLGARVEYLWPGTVSAWDGESEPPSGLRVRPESSERRLVSHS
jgi:hypothetical protein